MDTFIFGALNVRCNHFRFYLYFNVYVVLTHIANYGENGIFVLNGKEELSLNYLIQVYNWKHEKYKEQQCIVLER